MKFILALALIVSSMFAHAVNIPNQTQITYYYFDHNQTQNGLTDVQMDVRWLKEPDSNWGYYAQFFFTFQADVGGYTGLQQDSYSPEKKKAIFSLWDKTRNHKVRTITPWCKRFDWEGDGAQCIIEFQWVAGRDYSFKVAKVDEGVHPGVQRWAATVVDTTTDKVTLIGILEQPNYGPYIGSGNINPHNMATTLEFYVGDRNAPCSAMPYFGLDWYGPFANGGNISAKHAVVDYKNGVGAGCDNVSTVATGPSSTRQEVGRDIRPSNKHLDNVRAQFNYQHYDRLDCLLNWVESAFPARQDFPGVYRRMSRMWEGHYYRDYTNTGRGFKYVGVKEGPDEMFYVDNDGVYHGIGHVSGYLNPTSECRK